MPVARWSRCFPGRPSSVTEARRFVTAFAWDWPGLDAAELVVSELATNAIRHSRSGWYGGLFMVSIHVRSDRLWLGVRDEGGPSGPEVMPPNGEGREGGRGLLLVEAMTSMWGVWGDDSGRVVWAVLGNTAAGP